MRWNDRYNDYNAERTVTKFLLLPKWIKGEARWWERSSWVESPRDLGCETPEWTWVAQRWVSH